MTLPTTTMMQIMKRKRPKHRRRMAKFISKRPPIWRRLSILNLNLFKNRQKKNEEKFKKVTNFCRRLKNWSYNRTKPCMVHRACQTASLNYSKTQNVFLMNAILGDRFPRGQGWNERSVQRIAGQFEGATRTEEVHTAEGGHSNYCKFLFNLINGKYLIWPNLKWH